ncbi:uncharacterized protein LOC141649755 [Silene latifolia]|uniref:uncharacterized protein LOC141649755 n=1 Tax=Silene latifolia TaxID=37657 RepID=UPI003D7893A3
MILVDENGGVIQATIGKCLVKRFEDVIKDDYSYKITKFQSVTNLGDNIVVPHTCRLRFSYLTTAEEIEIESMPTYGFKFVSFKDVIENNLDGRDLIDVIGNVVECNEIMQKSDFHKTKVDIGDPSQEQLPLWLWGPYVVEASKMSRSKYFLVETPIVALQCVQRIVTRGLVFFLK